MSLVFLIGMPASGKSYWGKVLEESYRWRFVDIDGHIVETKGKTIAQIFEDEGEAKFREIESQALKEVVDNALEDTVVATGGGVVLSSDNMLFMKASGCVIYLETPIDILKERLEKDINNRPLFKNVSDIDILLKNLYEIRKPLYEQADHIFEYKNISVVNFEEILNKCIDRHLL
ncbi:MAG: shikimate kinase [Flavipsychrobacter sp.]